MGTARKAPTDPHIQVGKMARRFMPAKYDDPLDCFRTLFKANREQILFRGRMTGSSWTEANSLWKHYDVCFGSKADICSAKQHVRFTPNSDIKCDTGECPLWANSGHSALRQRLGLLDHLVGPAKQGERHRKSENL